MDQSSRLIDTPAALAHRVYRTTPATNNATRGNKIIVSKYRIESFFRKRGV